MPIVPNNQLSGRIVRALVELVKLYDVSEAALFSAANQPEPSWALTECRLPSADVYPLIAAALQLTQDPALGLRWAESAKDALFNPLHLMFEFAPTLRHAFAALNRCATLLTDAARFTLIEHGDTVAVRSLPPPASGAARRFMIEMQLGRLSRMMRSVIPEHHVRVDFDYPAPVYVAQYARVFRSATRFDQPHCEIVVEAELMDRPSPHPDRDVHDAMRQIAERRSMELLNRQPFSQRIMRLLVEHGPGERVEMATVARQLGMSERSLRRHLNAEGRRYPEIACSAQAELAKELLLRPEQSLQEVAWSMGFLCTSTFHQAFKKWTGSTPHFFRMQHVQRDTR